MRFFILTCSPDASHNRGFGTILARFCEKIQRRSYKAPIDQHYQRLSYTIMSSQFTTCDPRTDFIAPIEHTENPVYSHEARPASRNAISFIGDISRDGVALKRREKIFFNFLISLIRFFH